MDATVAHRPRPWTVFAGGSFRKLWGATALSLAGDNFSYVAMAWLVLQLTGSSLALGTVLVVQAVPRAVLMAVGGALTDRFSARLTMAASMGLRVALVAPLGALVLTGRIQLWEVYAASAVFGVVDAFFMPARTSILPRVVADHELEPGNAVLNVTSQASIVVAPALAGLVVAAWGTGWAFLVDGASFAAGFALVLWLPAAIRQADAPGGAAGLAGQMLAGFRYAWADVGIRVSLIIIAAIDFAASGAIGVGFPTLAHGRLGGSAAILGVLYAAWGVGATAGAVGAGLLRPPRRFGLLLVGVCAWIGAGIGLMGLLHSLPPVATVIAITAVATGVINTYGISWLQRRTNPEMQGRVMSLVMLASMGLTPIAYAVSGVIAQVNVTALFVIAGALILVTAAGAAASRTVRSL
jgi:hypothetical protein